MSLVVRNPRGLAEAFALALLARLLRFFCLLPSNSAKEVDKGLTARAASVVVLELFSHACSVSDGESETHRPSLRKAISARRCSSSPSLTQVL
jgi:hypothetical protein